MLQAISEGAAKAAIDSQQTYDALRDAQLKAASFKGGMHWKKVGVKEYLYRTFDGKGTAKSLGARSDETQAILHAFTQGKQAADARVRELEAKMTERSRVARALRAGSAPRLLAEICERLTKIGWMGRNIVVIGTNALYAYEALAGVRFDSDITATADIDLLWKHHSKLTMVADEAQSAHDAAAGLLGVLKKTDKTFELMDKQRFRAVNSAGYMVDLIRQMPRPPWKSEPTQMGGTDDFVATDLTHMDWMLSAPKLRQTVLAQDGRAFEMTVPDPRSFMLFKEWLSQQDERQPIKKGRDASQSKIMRQLLIEYLPQYPLDWAQFKSFPKSLTEGAATGSAI
jgi:hypothetical protein